jgi:hypothetical protein
MIDETGSDAFDKISAIIERARMACGQSVLVDAALVKTTEVWLEILDNVPADRLDDCYIYVMRERQIRTAVQPIELLHAWRQIAATELYRSASVDQRNVTDNTYRCLHCRDHGYQHVRVHRGGDYYSICARACICDAAPVGQRSASPLTPPEWRLNDHGEWERAKPFRAVRSAGK